MGKTKRLGCLVLLLLLTPLFSPLVTADSPPGPPQINAHWVADEFGETMHAYRVLFADGESYQALVDVFWLMVNLDTGYWLLVTAFSSD